MEEYMETKQRPQCDKYQNIPCRKIQANDATSAVRKQTIERILREREDGEEEEIREWVKKNLHTGKEEHKQNETI